MVNVSPAPAAGLPASFSWASSSPLIVPRSDENHNLVAVKDPTVVRYSDRWHVYASGLRPHLFSQRLPISSRKMADGWISG